MFVSAFPTALQIHMLRPDPKGIVQRDRAFGRWLGHEGRALLMGLVIKGAPESSRLP